MRIIRVKKIIAVAVSAAMMLSLMVAPVTVNAENDGNTSNAYVTLNGNGGITEDKKETALFPVEAYGKEAAVPDNTMFKQAGRKFVYWEGGYELFFPGDVFTPEEGMTLDACWMDENEVALITIDTVGGSRSSSIKDPGEFTVPSPYDSTVFDGMDFWFDCWNTEKDGSGTAYQRDQAISLNSGEILTLHAQWSDDLSQAWKVKLDMNNGDEDDGFVLGKNAYHWVKKGKSVPVYSFMEIDGMEFAGWYDSAEGGNLIALDGEEFTPDRDITLYAHWIPSEDQPSETEPSEPGESGITPAFSDVKDSDYYHDAVIWAADNGITSGTTDSTFSPNMNCTRAQLVTFLWRASGCPTVDYAMSFTDVNEDAYYAEAVRWAASEGITSGTGNSKFSPDEVVTRGQTVTFLYRMDKGEAADLPDSGFKDVATSEYYYDAVKWAQMKGITTGTSETEFSPEEPCTRAQIVTFIYRYSAD